MSQLIGLFGGTFDPVHQGHLNSVSLLDKALQFERVHWVLSARPPHKNELSANVEHRYAMLQLALQNYQHYLPDDSEISRAEASYTYTTTQYFRERYPDNSLCLIIGADSLQNLHTWYRYNELIDEVHLVVMHRPGYSMEIPKYLSNRQVSSSKDLSQSIAGKLLLFEQSDFDISSTQLREQLREGLLDRKQQGHVDQYLSKSVLDYIQQHKLYRSKSMNSEQVKEQAVDALESMKGVDISVINIRDVSDFADYMIVASGTSDTHVRALARITSDQLRQQGVKVLSSDGEDIGEWVLVDFGDVVVHVMRPEVREYYDLEKLWDEDVRNMVKQHRDEQEA